MLPHRVLAGGGGGGHGCGHPGWLRRRHIEPLSLLLVLLVLSGVVEFLIFHVAGGELGSSVVDVGLDGFLLQGGVHFLVG